MFLGNMTKYMMFDNKHDKYVVKLRSIIDSGELLVYMVTSPPTHGFQKCLGQTFKIIKTQQCWKTGNRATSRPESLNKPWS